MLELMSSGKQLKWHYSKSILKLNFKNISLKLETFNSFHQNWGWPKINLDQQKMNYVTDSIKQILNENDLFCSFFF